jgi:hypothetical protein
VNAGQSGEEGTRRVFFFVNKKEAKKTLIILDRAGFTAMGPKLMKFFASRVAMTKRPLGRPV